MAICLKMKSDYSFLSSTITFNDAISFCKQNHLKVLSLIDNNLHGALEFYELCNKNYIKPIIGVEVMVKYDDVILPLVFIAKSELGYKNISRISSISNSYLKNYIEFKELSLYTQDVIVVISSEDSYLNYCFVNNNIYDANMFIDDIKVIFKEYYIGIYRYRSANNQILSSIKEFANHISFKCIAMQYATHKTEKDTIILNLLDCIKNNEAANKNFLNNPSICEAYLKNDELLKVYYDKDELDNLNNMISKINLKISKIDFSLPLVYKDENINDKLLSKTLKGLKDKKLENDEKYQKRVQYELDIINKMGFANYYLVVADYINYAKNNDIPVGPSRGSGAASLVAYLLNITTIDPLKHDLLFERFLNPSRINYPDFDIDFADVKRDEIIKYVKEKYGYRRVGHISTFATFGVKSAIRDIARILKTPNDDIDYIMKAISSDCKSINDEYNNNAKFKALLDIHSNYKTICSFASQIEGLKKQVGIHAAGMILSNDNLDEILPCYQADENTMVIQYDYVNAEKYGIIKMDFLGLKNLTIIDYALKKINKQYNTNYTIDNFSFDYKQAYDLIASGNNIGIFQLESEGMNNVIMKLKPTCFDDIVAILALYRPGPMKMIPTYIERKNGKSFDYFAKEIENILKPTYGIIIYQEQIMQICQIVANFSLGDADILRRAISKKKIDLINSEKEKFINGCVSNGYSKEKASELFSFIERFASYGFNKAHSVGYASIATMMAYIKAKYPSIFYEALLNVNNESGEKMKKTLYEAKKANINILKPNVLTSSQYFTSDNNSITFGLANIKTIKSNIANIIINERSKETFNDLNDFIIRMALNDVSLQVLFDLTYAGALDCFNVSKEKISANLNNLYSNAMLYKGLDYKPNTYKDEKYSLFIQTPILFYEDEETDFLKKEYELLDMYLSIHPLKSIKESYKNISNIEDINNDGFYDIIAKITLIEVRKTKENKNYININIEDETKSINVKNYNNYLFFKDNFSKGDIIKANVTMKNNYLYINNASKIEVKK